MLSKMSWCVLFSLSCLVILHADPKITQSKASSKSVPMSNPTFSRSIFVLLIIWFVSFCHSFLSFSQASQTVVSFGVSSYPSTIRRHQTIIHIPSPSLIHIHIHALPLSINSTQQLEAFRDLIVQLLIAHLLSLLLLPIQIPTQHLVPISRNHNTRSQRRLSPRNNSLPPPTFLHSLPYTPNTYCFPSIPFLTGNPTNFLPSSSNSPVGFLTAGNLESRVLSVESPMLSARLTYGETYW